MTIFLLLLGAALIYLVQDRLYARRWSQGLGVSIRFPKQVVVEGETASLVEVITNAKRLPLPILHVKFQISRNLRFGGDDNTSVSDLSYRHDIFSILFYQKITRTLEFQCTKRGFYAIDQANLVATNLFLTRSMVSSVKQNAYMYVYPRTVSTESIDLPFKKAMGTLLSKRYLFEDPFEFRGIRDYEITDPMNSINWKATAKTGDLMVNVHHSTLSQEAVIFLDLQDDTLWKYENLHEMAIRIAASFAIRFLEQSIPTRILCNGKDQITKEIVQVPAGSGRRQMDAINESLSRIDLSQDPVPCTEQMAEELANMGNRHPYYILIGNSFGHQRKEYLKQLADLGSGAMWIALCEKNQEIPTSPSDNLEIVKWEVQHEI